MGNCSRVTPKAKAFRQRDPGTSPVTIPAHTPVVGDALGFFAGRVYAPSGTLFDESDITVVFAGYHTQKPKNGLGDYRTIGRFSLHSSQEISAVR
jgi:hypothetical protein